MALAAREPLVAARREDGFGRPSLVMHIVEDFASAEYAYCGAGPLSRASLRPAAEVPASLRCYRPGCAAHYARADEA